MAHEFEEHWLSAYLDNELSADERALVEQRLQTDAVARQLFDDLKRVRSLVATLPGWQGTDLQPAALNLQSAAQTADEASDGQPLASGSSAQVEYSTSLAESRLRERENAAAAQTRRSMRWTTLVAVAAGLATVMLGAPYVLRSLGPVTEVAQHVDSPAAKKDSSEPPVSAPSASASARAGLAKEAPEESGSGIAVEQHAPSNYFDAAQLDRQPSLAAPRDHALGERFSRGAVEGASRERYFAENAQNEPTDGERLKERTSGGMPGSGAITEDDKSLPLGGGMGGYGMGGGGMQAGAAPGGAISNGALLGGRGNAPSDAPAPSPGPLAPHKPEVELGLAPRPAVPQDALSFGTAPGDSAASPAEPASPEAKIRSLEAHKSRDSRQEESQEESLGAALAETAGVPAPIVTARSDTWTDAQAAEAMNQVWYFISPGASADGSGSQSGAKLGLGTDQQVPASGATNDWVQSNAAATNAPVSEGIASARSFSKQPSFRTQPPGGDVANRGMSASAAAAPSENAPAGAGPTRQASGEPPAIGLARLPADQTATAWLEQLRQQQAVTPLKRLDESERLAQLNDQVASSVRGADAGAVGGKSQSAQAQTVVLFVSASEARQILQSLESNTAKAARLNLPALEAAKDADSLGSPATASAAELPPAWWTRPQTLLKKNADKAGQPDAVGDEKVILILSQLPGN